MFGCCVELIFFYFYEQLQFFPISTPAQLGSAYKLIRNMDDSWYFWSAAYENIVLRREMMEVLI